MYASFEVPQSEVDNSRFVRVPNSKRFSGYVLDVQANLAFVIYVAKEKNYITFAFSAYLHNHGGVPLPGSLAERRTNKTITLIDYSESTIFSISS